ncbi:MAG: AraC family transcriptional regulator [Bacteroides graminisolvens]|nr:AraC family transcriptional regulator [Bacteroides graminisolvens]
MIQYKWSWLALPSFLLAIYSAVIYSLMTPSEVESFIQGVMYQKSGYEPYSRLVRLQILREHLFKVLFSVQVILSVYFVFRLINKYNKRVKAFYSNLGGKDLTPMKWAVAALLLASMVSVLANSIGNSYFITHPQLLFIPFTIYSVCIFFSAYVSYMQRFTIEHFTQNVNEYELSRVFTVKKPVAHYYIPGMDNLKSLRDRLIYLLEKMEIFKNPELKISDVSLLLKTNRTYVSKVVNEELNTNFCDLVNSYRVNYAEELLCSPEQANSLSIAEIAEMSGFSSESSFYRVFKNKKGISPGVYKQHRCNVFAVNG